MALTLKNLQVEALAEEVAQLTGETKTEAVRKSLLERRERIHLTQGRLPQRNITRFLETHIWPTIPEEVLGSVVSKEQEEEWLGYGPEGA